MPTLGEMIRAAREAKSLGLCDLARQIKVTSSYLCNIEHDREVPAELLLWKITSRIDLEFDQCLDARCRPCADTKRYMKQNLAVMVLVRRMAKWGLGEEDIQRLITEADRLGEKIGDHHDSVDQKHARPQSL